MQAMNPLTNAKPNVAHINAIILYPFCFVVIQKKRGSFHTCQGAGAARMLGLRMPLELVLVLLVPRHPMLALVPLVLGTVAPLVVLAVLVPRLSMPSHT